MNLIKNIWYSLKYDLKRNYWLFKDSKSNYHGVVLMFHHVTDDYVAINESCKCKITNFRQILQSYLEHGYEFVTIEEALSKIQESEPSRFVVVTFDDIPDSVYVHAYPILKELSIPFAVFVTVGFIDKDSFITKHHLQELCTESLCTIGAHTMTHPMLRQIKSFKSEIGESKKELEKITGKDIRFFAYPFGRYSSVSKEVRRATAESGFECAFSTICAPLNEASAKDLFFLPRFSPTPDNNAINKYKFTFPRAIISLISFPFKKIKRLKK